MSDEPLYLILLGPPASGKGTQATYLHEALDIPHVSSGDLFRYNLKNDTDLGQKAKRYIEEGELVPDDITIAMVMERLNREDCENGAILDGFPRTLTQAQALDEALAEEGEVVDMVLNIEVPEQELIERVTGRRLCKNCGATYHIKFNPPEREGLCDECGGELYQRPDDTEETVRTRLQVYRDQTKPLIRYYDKKGSVVNINGDQPIPAVTEEMLEAVSDL
jgi:adenylate kinase